MAFWSIETLSSKGALLSVVFSSQFLTYSCFVFKLSAAIPPKEALMSDSWVSQYQNKVTSSMFKYVAGYCTITIIYVALYAIYLRPPQVALT